MDSTTSATNTAVVKQPPTIVPIQVDVDKLLLDDLPLMAMFADQTPAGQLRMVQQMDAVMDMLDRVVVGGARGKGYPLRALGEIMTKINTSLQAETSAKN